jgi:hypothetical protein
VAQVKSEYQQKEDDMQQYVKPPPRSTGSADARIASHAAPAVLEAWEEEARRRDGDGAGGGGRDEGGSSSTASVEGGGGGGGGHKRGHSRVKSYGNGRIASILGGGGLGGGGGGGAGSLDLIACAQGDGGDANPSRLLFSTRGAIRRTWEDNLSGGVADLRTLPEGATGADPWSADAAAAEEVKARLLGEQARVSHAG